MLFTCTQTSTLVSSTRVESRLKLDELLLSLLQVVAVSMGHLYSSEGLALQQVVICSSWKL